MEIQITCGSDDRRQAVRKSTSNGIDYLEVIPIIGDKGKPDLNYPPLLLVYCFKDITDIDEHATCIIEGGIRIKNIKVELVTYGDRFETSSLKPKEKEVIKEINESRRRRLLVVRPNTDGDFSNYTLKLIKSKDETESPPNGFDSLFSQVNFSFKVDCESYFDCVPEKKCPPELLSEPVIDYMAKDYASFRRLMLDRMSSILPNWKERNPADLGMMLVELLAYVGDHLSYFQDAVATEAYLGTALKRISVRRHARLLDYHIGEGCNARVWIWMEVDKDHSGLSVPTSTRFLASSETPEETSDNIIRNEQQFQEALLRGTEVFETMHDLILQHAHNEMHFYTWGNSKCCLPKGSTRCTLMDDKDEHKSLKVGDILIFEEIRSPTTGNPDQADSSHSHAVRLTEVTKKIDILNGTPVIDVSWHPDDALPFPLCLWDYEGLPVSIARGNIVLADHGYTFDKDYWAAPIYNEDGDDNEKFIPVLSKKPLTFRAPFDSSLPAASAFNFDHEHVNPDITLTGDEKTWHGVYDLLSSDKFKEEFVVEIENDGTAYIRFGDNILGSKPNNSTRDKSNYFYAKYRVGNGKNGNVGARTITRIVNSGSFNAKGITRFYNVMEAKGGRDPEYTDQVRQFAPVAFRTQRRAVTEQDYVDVLKRCPKVQAASAMIRWTGSWYTVFITIDRYDDGKDIDEDDFKLEIYNLLNEYRLAGYDLKIQDPVMVPLDIEMMVCVKENYFRSEVQKALLQVFSNENLESSGRLGFFHPDNFSFGKAVFLSQIYKTAMEIEGVASIDVMRFQRWGRIENGELDAATIKIGSFEIARLDNDPNFPENGKISFVMRGGI